MAKNAKANVSVQCGFKALMSKYEDASIVEGLADAISEELSTAYTERMKELKAVPSKPTVEERVQQLIGVIESKKEYEAMCKLMIPAIKEMKGRFGVSTEKDKEPEKKAVIEVKVEATAEEPKEPAKKSEKKSEPKAKTEKKTEGKKTKKEKKSDRPEDEFGKVFQGVNQIMSVTAKVRKELGLTLKKYVKADGTESKVYIFSGKDAKTTKVLHDLLATEAYSKIAHYKGWANGYVVADKNVDEFSKKMGVKTA